MVSRLILIAAFLISAAPPRSADYERCVMITNPPLITGHGTPIEDTAPVSELARWAK